MFFKCFYFLGREAILEVGPKNAPSCLSNLWSKSFMYTMCRGWHTIGRARRRTAVSLDGTRGPTTTHQPDRRRWSSWQSSLTTSRRAMLRPSMWREPIRPGWSTWSGSTSPPTTVVILLRASTASGCTAMSPLHREPIIRWSRPEFKLF